MIIILAAVTVALVGGGGAAGYFLSGGAHASSAEGAEGGAPAAEHLSPEKEAEIVGATGRQFGTFVEVAPVTSNLADGDGSRFIRVTLQLEVANEVVKTRIDAAMIPIRSAVVQYFSGKMASDLLGRDGQTKSQEDLVEVINDVMGSGFVQHVYFTEAVVQ